MKKTILIYAAGLAWNAGEGVFSSDWFGYLVMLVALSLIFFGVKRYRDTEPGGVIRFGEAFLLGTGIVVVAGVAYVAAREAYLAGTDYAFVDLQTERLI